MSEFLTVYGLLLLLELACIAEVIGAALWLGEAGGIGGMIVAWIAFTAGALWLFTHPESVHR